MAQFVTQDEFDAFRSESNERYEQIRKLITQQTIAVDAKLKAMANELHTITSRKPDPAMIKEFWIRQVPRMRDELAKVQLDLAKLLARLNKETVPHG